MSKCLQAWKDAVFMGALGQAFMSHLVDLDSSLSGQLEDASMVAHMLFIHLGSADGMKEYVATSPLAPGDSPSSEVKGAPH